MGTRKGYAEQAAPKQMSTSAVAKQRLSLPKMRAPDSVQSADPQWELVQRIVASRGFERSLLLTNFLLFVCERALTGRVDTIHEEEIGVHVFGREERFNRADDNIVRNYARILRKRIDDYFQTEGRSEILLLHVPRGAYVPVFAERCPPAANVISELELFDPEEDLSEQAKQAPAVSSHRDNAPLSPAVQSPKPRSGAALAMYLLLSGMLGFLLARGLPIWSLHPQPEAEQISGRFWRQMFDQHRDTFLVPTDGGLVTLSSFLPQTVTLTTYLSGGYRDEDTIASGLQTLLPTANPRAIPILIEKIEKLGTRRATSIVDLDLASAISRRPEVVSERLMIRSPRDLRMADLKMGNAILLGSVDSNPWVELFQREMNFQFDYGSAFGGSATITNRRPLAGEQAKYASVTGDPLQTTYGVLAYLPNLDGTGHVLIIEGINTAGTEAAGEFLLSPGKLKPVLDLAMTPDGEVEPFELLIKTESIGANSSQSQIISERVGSSHS